MTQIQLPRSIGVTSHKGATTRKWTNLDHGDRLGNRSTKNVGYLLVAGNSNNDFAFSRFHIAFKVKDLLPSAEDGIAIANGNGEIWTKPRSLQVRMSISVMPCLFVPVLTVRRKELVQNFRQVALETRFKLDGSDNPR